MLAVNKFEIGLSYTYIPMEALYIDKILDSITQTLLAQLAFGILAVDGDLIKSGRLYE